MVYMVFMVYIVKPFNHNVSYGGSIMNLKVNQWAKIEFIVFFKIMPNLGVFSTLYF